MTDRLNVSKVISEDAIDETTRSLGTSDAGISETARVHESSKSAHIRLRKDSEPGVTRKDDSNANTANAGGESPNRKLKDAVNAFMSLKKRSTFLHDSSVKDDPQDTAERRGSLRAQMISGHYDGASFSHNRTHRDELNIEVSDEKQESNLLIFSRLTNDNILLIESAKVGIRKEAHVHMGTSKACG